MAAISFFLEHQYGCSVVMCKRSIGRVYNLRGQKQKLLGKLFYEFLTKVAQKKKSDFSNRSRTYDFQR